MSNASVPIPGELRSRKFRTAVFAVVASIVGLRMGMTEDQITKFVLAPLMMYIGTQGLADFGKERVALERDPETPTAPK